MIRQFFRQVLMSVVAMGALILGEGVAGAQAPGHDGGAPPQSSRTTKSSAADSPWGIDLGLNLNRVAGATWWDITPKIKRALDEHWTLELAVPIRLVPGTLTDDGLSHAGLGDLYGSIAVEVGTDDVTFNSELSASAATGSASKGLGSGEAEWDWINHVEKDFGSLTPYAEAGFSNSVDYATRISRNRAGGLTGATASSTGTLFNGELGTSLNLSDSVSLSVSGYISRGVGSQTVVTRTVTPRRPGTGRAPLLTTSNAGDDAGFASTLDGVLTRGVDVSVVFWRSTTYQYNTLSAGITLKLVDLFRK